MKTHPILFSGTMVRGVLDDSKTQTRRLVKPQPEKCQVETACSLKALLSNAPYQSGDQLFVRETWQTDPAGEWGTCYQASGHNPLCKLHDHLWRPSIHMPRALSRITLEVTEVRMQRLQEISEEDAKAEGLHQDANGLWTWGGYPSGSNNPVYAFHLLWDSIYETTAPWDSNPLVWAYTFKRIK